VCRVACYIQEQLLIDRAAKFDAKIRGEFSRNCVRPAVQLIFMAHLVIILYAGQE